MVMLVSLLGGLGVFLLGMVMLTDGLKAVAGDALRRILTRHVATPVAGVGWGALVTALVQSSTATTTATVGFVSAGLLTFPQAIGVIFGANVGTTSTGWIVSQLGFKVSLGAVAPPLVLAGVAMRLMFKGRPAFAGTALAGFSLLFMGIGMLQSGMGTVASHLTPGDLPGSTGHALGARLALVGFGFLMTVVMQSSSASMTTTLAAVASGAIGLEQAAALAIGQNIGTTPTAVAAAFGAPTAAKRTAASHVLFNVLTAIAAIAGLPWLLRACEWTAHLAGANDAPTVLALFHSAFNAFGVLLLVPLIRPYARMIELMFPERGPRATRYLSPSVARVGPVAIEAARRALVHVMSDAASMLVDLLGHSPRRAAPAASLLDATTGLQSTVRFIHGLGQESRSAGELSREQALLHAVDHLDRLLDAIRRLPDVVADMESLRGDPVVASACDPVEALARRFALLAQDGTPAGTGIDPSALAGDAARVSTDMAGFRRDQRRLALQSAATGEIDPDYAMRRIDALLWLDGAAYHLWRAAHYLRPDAGENSTRTGSSQNGAETNPPSEGGRPTPAPTGTDVAPQTPDQNRD